MSYEPKIEIDGEWYFAAPYSSVALGPGVPEWRSMIIIGSVGLLSFVTTLGFASFIIYRFLRYRWRCQTFEGYNQYVILVLNLLIADCQQAIGFVVNFRWITIGRILAPSHTCSAQGWLLNSGDVASGLFVLLIALHTLVTAAYGRRISLRVFTAAICSAWFLAYFFTAVAWSLHGERFFVRSATWCWISPVYEPARLMAHYFWLFLAQAGTIFVYIITFSKLRRTTGELSEVHIGDHWTTETIAAVRHISTLMMLYPAVYVVLTLPISVARMWSWAHHEPVVEGPFMTIAACLLVSCGWIDCILYTMTRRRLIQAMVTSRGSPGHNNLELADVGSTMTPEESRKSEIGFSEALSCDKEVEENLIPRAPQQLSPIVHVRTDPREYRRKLAPIYEVPDTSSWWFNDLDMEVTDQYRKYRRKTFEVGIDINSIGVIPPVYSPTSPSDSPASRSGRERSVESLPGSRPAESKEGNAGRDSDEQYHHEQE